ncbi:MAG: hypothetical protein JSU60_03180 [Nitrospirota bacterium]|nr:MAG: hypothetical protein JSU60_03180 [Nitrospirota bacterium]
MKTTIFASSPVPTKTIKQGSLQRLSLAVKKLDQLINRANQLGKLPLQVFSKDKIEKPIPLSETNPNQSASSDS